MLDQAVPDFSLPATGGTDFRLSAQAGHPVVLYFYPKDHTPGCTTESAGFRDLHEEFVAAGVRIVGISRDGIKSHESFRAKLQLPFPLASDTDETVCRLFGVMKEKTLYGRKLRGIERSTFVIDAKGILRREWRGVKVDGHPQEVLNFARSL